MTNVPRRPVRIANCSGFFGDRLRAPEELLAGPDPIDVLTGDYLAELTMLILHKARVRDPAAGYAQTFVRQMQRVLTTCIDRDIKVVSNAGGSNPHALANALRAIDERVKVAVVDGDDVRELLQHDLDDGVPLVHLDTGASLPTGTAISTANAYLGGWGIAHALAGGADVVICGRVTDASLVVGASAWWHDWSPSDADILDALAGAVVAGHVIECGPQCCGGNYPFLDELERGPIGFPIAEVHHDGASVITKQPGTGGAVNIGTVTAQLLYEIGAPAYLGPDVTTHFDTIAVHQLERDRVRIDGAKGSPPSNSVKVAINVEGGFRNTMTLMLTGLAIEAKAAYVEQQLFDALGGRDHFDEVTTELIRSDREDAPSNALAMAQLRITVKDRNREKVGRRFSSGVVELALASYAGLFVSTPPGDASAYGVYWPILIDRNRVTHTVTDHDGEVHAIENVVYPASPVGAPDGDTQPTSNENAFDGGAGASVPLGSLCGARSGDKGPNANVGVWTWSDELFEFLVEELTVERFLQLVPDAANLWVERHVLANLRSLNFVVHGLLGEGVASSTRVDAQAKGLGEYLRSRSVEVPQSLLHHARS